MERIALPALEARTKQAPPVSERSELIGKFTDGVNASRGKKYKKLTHAYVASKLAHLSVSDLYAFLKQCEQARSFGAMFHWALKPKTNDPIK